MDRFALTYLERWQSKANRKPLVIRGARQVGKTCLVRLFAQERFENMLEINFERYPEMATLFASKDPKSIAKMLELQFNIPILPGRTLLFLDEIQAAPEVLACLRYFREELPELHVISAGSLLEFAMEEPVFSMPVGRIEYLYLGPMQFEEFLLAAGEKNLVDFLGDFSLQTTIPSAIHGKFMGLLRQYLVTGGMPESVDIYLKSNSWRECEAVKHTLQRTFEDDFNKYGGRIRHQRLQLVFRKIPFLVGNKFKYVNVDRNARSAEVANALRMLCQARVAFPVYHSSCTGIPLGATVDERKFKVLFLDVGLLTSAVGLNLLEYEKAEDIMLVSAGAVCEQFVGQHLLFSQDFYREPELCCWVREKRTSSAEVDYVIAIGSSIIPVEVKAGKGGTLKSLHLFLRERRRALGVRFNAEPPSLLDLETALSHGPNVSYRLLSLPLYLVGQARRLLSEYG